MHWIHLVESIDRRVLSGPMSAITGGWLSFGYIHPFTQFFPPVPLQAAIPWSAQYSLSVLPTVHTAAARSLWLQLFKMCTTHCSHVG